MLCVCFLTLNTIQKIGELLKLMNNLMENNSLNQKEFLSLFSNPRFRYIHDVNKETIQGNNVLDLSLNQEGYGIFFTVNGFPPIGEATIPNILSLNCNFADLDIKNIPQDERDRIINQKLMRAYEEGLLMPTIVVRTKNGVHLYWLYSNPIFSPTSEQMLLWRDIQNRLVKYFDGDPQAKDSARVLRLPFTMHLKDPKDPFEVKIQSCKPDCIYTIDELDSTFPRSTEDELSKEKTPAMELLLKGVPVGEGLRHGALAQMAGLFLRGADTPEKVATARMNYYNWDKKVVGSPERFEERKKELDNTFEGVFKLHLNNKNNLNKKYNQSQELKSRKSKAITRCLADIQSIPINWLWEGRIAIGKLTMIAGDPGLGKSLITANLATKVSRGYPWPVDESKPPIGDVILISAEDDPADTIKPRLEAMEADCTRIHIIESIKEESDIENEPTQRMFSFKRDITTLSDLLSHLPNCNLVIIDPISAYLDSTDSNNNSDIRGLLAPLAELASKHKVAIVLISHLNKNSGGNASYRVMGSLAFTAAVRSAFIVTKDKNNPERRLFMPLKNNLGKDSTGFAYSIIEINGAPTIAWELEPVKITIDEALNSSESGSEPNATDEAVEFLKFVLFNGPVKADEAFKEAKQAGIKEKPLRIAREKLGIKPRKIGFNNGSYWVWELVEDAQKNEDAQPKIQGIFEVSGHLHD